MLKTLVGCCLKGFRAEHVQKPCRVLLKGLRKWAQPPYDQKVFKTDRFRHDFVMVLHRYQLLEIFQKSGRIPSLQTDRKVLLKGLRGGACSKPSWGVA